MLVRSKIICTFADDGRMHPSAEAMKKNVFPYTDDRRDYQINSSPPGWLLWCNPFNLCAYGKVNELGIDPRQPKRQAATPAKSVAKTFASLTQISQRRISNG